MSNDPQISIGPFSRSILEGRDIGFPHRLKSFRLRKGWTQADVANACGLQPAAYAFFEQGIREPSFANLKKLCAGTGVSADYLLGLSEISDIIPD